MARHHNLHRAHTGCVDSSDSIFSELERSRGSTKRRVYTDDRRTRHHLHHQVNDLCEDLSKSNHTMKENEHLMSHFQDASEHQQTKISQLRRDLDQSRELLHQSSHAEVGRSQPLQVLTSCTGPQHSTALDIEREKLARERADTEKSRMMDLLNTSLTHPHPVPCSTHCPVQSNPVLQGLSSELRALKNELMETQFGVTKTEATTASIESRVKHIEQKVEEGSAHGINVLQLDELAKEIKAIKEELQRKEESQKQQRMLEELKAMEIKLSNEQDYHINSRQEVQRLSNELQKLEEELHYAQEDKRKVASYLTATSQKLDASVLDKESLVQQIEELRCQLKNSDEARIQSETRNTTLVEKLRNQELRQQKLKEKIVEVEKTIQNNQEEYSVMSVRIRELSSLLATSQEAECHWRDSCGQLETMLSERASQDEMLSGLRRQMKELEQEASQGRLEVAQLRTELQANDHERSSLLRKISELEGVLHERDADCSQLKEEIGELSMQLQSCLQERSLMMEQEARSLDRIKSLQEKYQRLDDESSELKKRLEEEMLKCTDTQTASDQTLQKYKNKCKQLLQDKCSMRRDYERLQSKCRCKQFEDELIQCQAALEAEREVHLILQHESNKLKSKYLVAEKKLTQLVDKACVQYRQLESQKAKLQASEETLKNSKIMNEEEHSQLQSDKETLVIENSALQQELSEMKERAGTLCSQLENLRSEHIRDTEKMSTHNSGLAKKQEKLVQVCKSLKVDVTSLQNECSFLKSEKEKIKHELKKVEQTHLFDIERLQQETEVLKVSHRQELDSLVQEHNKTVSLLKQEAAQLEVKLSDEQSTLRAVRLQQQKVIEDQHRIIHEDLSRSFKDSERVRLKYMKTKRYLQEKIGKLQRRLDTTRHEDNIGLCYSSLTQESLVQTTDEQNALLKALAVEVDIMVGKISQRVDIPEFLTMPPKFGSGTKTLFAELLTKTQWLKKEVLELVAQEERLLYLLKTRLPNEERRDHFHGCHQSKTDINSSSFQLEHLY